MKTLKIFTMIAFVAFNGQAIAKPNVTNLTFAKGSFCTSFDGNIVNREFTVYTKAEQELAVNPQSIDKDEAVISVKDPKGRLLKEYSSDEWKGWQFFTQRAGKHTITITPDIDDDEAVFVNFEVCAY